MLSSLILAADDFDPMPHVLDKGSLGGISMHLLTMLVAVGLCVWVLTSAADAIETGREDEGNDRFLTKGRLSQMIEVVVLYLLDNVIRPQLGHAARKFAPFLLTLFFFILFNNLLGLVPLLDLQHLIGYFTTGDKHAAWVGGTATGNLAVTLALAVISFVVIQVAGIRSAGISGWLKHLTAGAPWFIWPIIIPVEILGTFIKPGALAIRLFANMTAGHVLLAVLLSFTFMFLGHGQETLNLLVGGPVAILAIVASVAIMFLEVFVAFLQAFIFMFLTTMFIAQMMHHDHDDHAAGEEYDIDHPLVDDKSVPVSAV